MTPTTTLRLYDTTLRDGTQREGLSLSVEDKVKIACALDRLGVSYIEGGWPGSNPKDADFFRRIRGVPLANAKVAAFGSTRRAGLRCEDDASLRALVDAETPVVTLVGKSSTLHVKRILETTLDENLRMIGESVAFFKRLGREVVYDAEHFFDGFRLDAAYALDTLAAAAEAGADCLVLCDTNGGELPDVVAERVHETRAAFPTPIGIHPHNDAGLGVANGLAAVRAGCVQAQGTINGYGERCGNLDLVPLVATLQLKLGYEVLPEASLRRLTEVSQYVAAVANQHPDPHAPYVGRSAFAHKGGIHVAAIAKVADSYQHVDPARVGNEMRVVISEVAGRRNVRLRAEALGLAPAGGEGAVLQRIKELEHRGFQFEAAEGSFEMLLRREAPGYRAPFVLEDFTVIVEKRGGDGSRAQATVRLRVGEEMMHTAAEGDGPVNALDRAVRKALLPHYPALADVHLVDYKVRIVDEHLGTGARPRVIVETARDAERWSTVGCSENIIEASWMALCDGLELALLRSSAVERDARPQPEPSPAPPSPSSSARLRSIPQR
ncbi:MAG: citramalate synthase [Gemmatimonadales bacterium]